MSPRSPRRLAPDLLIVATTGCDLACDHCFGPRGERVMSLEILAAAASQHARLAARRGASRVLVYWQGGDVLTLGTEWLAAAAAVVREAYGAAGVEARHHLQTSLASFDPEWIEPLRGLFGRWVSTSFDVPNLFRHLPGGEPAELEPVFRDRYRLLLDSGFHGSLIALVNEGSVALGPEGVLERLFEGLDVVDLQVNLPFPSAQRDHDLGAVEDLLRSGELSRFVVGLYDEWVRRYRRDGRLLSPFIAMERHVATEGARGLPCVWSADCGRSLVAVGPEGVVGPCDVWVLAYPERCYGDLPSSELEALLDGPRRRTLAGRAGHLAAGECSGCDELQSCHGGCPARALAWRGDERVADPCCGVYRAMLKAVRARRPRLRSTS